MTTGALPCVRPRMSYKLRYNVDHGRSVAGSVCDFDVCAAEELLEGVYGGVLLGM